MSTRHKVTGLWTTIGPFGTIHWSSTGLHLNMRQAIAKLVARLKRCGATWPKLKRMGYRVIRVNLTEVPHA